MQVSITRKVVLGFSFALAILCVIGVASVHSIGVLIDNMERVARSYRVLAELGDVSNMAKDIQSSVRGYVITGNEDFLVPYRDAQEAMKEQIREVETLLQRKPELARKLNELKALITEQRENMILTIELRRTQGPDAAIERVRSGEGERRLEAIRRISREMDDLESQVLSDRTAEAQDSARDTLTVIVIGSLLALVVVAAAILIIARDIRDRERLEKSVVEAGEREQRRIGQDLHDGLCQQIAGAAFMSRALEEEMTDRLPHEAAAAGRIGEVLNRAVSHARGLARGLHPVELEAGGLMSALEELATSVNAFFGVACHFDCAKPVLVADNAVAVHVYRIAQEAVHNAVRHGKPQQVKIILTSDHGMATLEVRDDGCGLPPGPVRRRGMGMDTMRYRANAIGSALVMGPGAEGGTVVRCTFKSGPLPATIG
jgi:signal transduction histidine kinase